MNRSKCADTIAAAEEAHDPPEGLVEKTAGNSTSGMQQHTPTVLPSEHMEAGKGGEGGVFQVTNAEFIAAVFTDLPEGASAAVCSKPGNPASGGWVAHRADRLPRIFGPDHNSYLGCSGAHDLLFPSITTTSAVRVSIREMTVRSRRAKPSLPPAIS